MARYGPAILRIAVGVVFVTHAAQALPGGWRAVGMLVAIVQLGAGAMLVAGLLTRAAALALLVEMAVVIWKLDRGMAPGRGHDYEFILVLVAALLSLILGGPGAFSVDGHRARDAESEAAGRARLRAGKV